MLALGKVGWRIYATTESDRGRENYWLQIHIWYSSEHAKSTGPRDLGRLRRGGTNKLFTDKLTWIASSSPYAQPGFHPGPRASTCCGTAGVVRRVALSPTGRWHFAMSGGICVRTVEHAVGGQEGTGRAHGHGLPARLSDEVENDGEALARLQARQTGDRVNSDGSAHTRCRFALNFAKP